MGLRERWEQYRREKVHAKAEELREKAYYKEEKEKYRRINTGKGELSEEEKATRYGRLQKKAQMDAENEAKYGGRVKRFLHKVGKAKRGRSTGGGAYGSPKSSRSIEFGGGSIAANFYADRAAAPKNTRGQFSQSAVWPDEFSSHHRQSHNMISGGTMFPRQFTSSRRSSGGSTIGSFNFSGKPSGGGVLFPKKKKGGMRLF